MIECSGLVPYSLLLNVEAFEAGVDGGGTEIFFDAEELVVLGDAFGAAGGTGLDLTGIESHGQVGDGGIFGFAGTVGGHGGVAGLVGHLDGFEGFGDGTDLVELDEDGVAALLGDTLGESLGIGYEQVVTDELDAVAEFAVEDLPAFPVFFVEAVFDGVDRILVDELLPVPDEFFGGEGLSALGELVFANFVGLPFGRGGIHREDEILAGFEAGEFNGFEDALDGFFVAGQVGGETTFVADGGGESLALEEGLEGVEDFGAPAEAFTEAFGTSGHDHEFLNVNGIGRVGAAVENVHHGDGQTVGIGTAEEAVQGDAEAVGGSAGGSDGDREDGVGAEVGFVLGAVGGEHGGIHRVGVGGIHALQGIIDFGVDVFDCLGDTLAAETGLVAVAEFERFENAGGSAAGGNTAADGAVHQDDFGFNGGIAAGVDDFAGDDFFDCELVHVNRFPFKRFV